MTSLPHSNSVYVPNRNSPSWSELRICWWHPFWLDLLNSSSLSAHFLHGSWSEHCRGQCCCLYVVEMSIWYLSSVFFSRVVFSVRFKSLSGRTFIASSISASLYIDVSAQIAFLRLDPHFQKALLHVQFSLQSLSSTDWNFAHFFIFFSYFCCDLTCPCTSDCSLES